MILFLFTPATVGSGEWVVHQIVHMSGGDEFNVVYHLDSDKDWLFGSPSGRGGARKQPVKGKEHFDAEMDVYMSSLIVKKLKYLKLAWSGQMRRGHLENSRKVPLDRHSIVINSVASSWDSNYIVAVTSNNMVCIWRLRNEELDCGV